MKTTRSVHTLLLGLVLCTALMANKRDAHQTNAPPKPEGCAWDVTEYDNTCFVKPSNTLMFSNRYEYMDVTSNVIVKVSNECIVPMRTVMVKLIPQYARVKQILWPDSKRYIRWLLRPQCTAIH